MACVAGLETMLRRLVGAIITLTVLLETEPWNVMVDTSKVEQIVMNLVVNARDGMPAERDLVMLYFRE